MSLSPNIGLQTLLLAEATVTAIVVSRIHLDRCPQGELRTPHIVIDTIDEDPLLTLDGATGGLAFVDFDIDCKAPTAADAVAMALVVRDHIKDYTGPLGPALMCRAVLFRGISSEFEKPLDGTDTGRHVRTVDVQIQYEPNP